MTISKESGYGAQSMVAPLRRVVVRAPEQTFGSVDPDRWHYAARPDQAAASAEHDALVSLLADAGAEIIRHDAPLPGLADALFVHDPVLVTERGTVVLRMGKQLRRGEEEPLAACLQEAGVPVLGRLEGEATAECGDLLWIDRQTLAVGQGFRTNREGLRQLRDVLGGIGVECVAVPLPVYCGADACLHLMSLISILDEDLAVAFEPLLPVPFWELVHDRGVRIVPVPEEELATQGPNVLALGPRRCVMLEDNPITEARLLAAGCEVTTYRGRELSLKAEGGATCLTRPVLRG